MSELAPVKMVQPWGPRVPGELVDVDAVRGLHLVARGLAVPAGPFHAAGGSRWHTSWECKVGNNAELENVRFGTGGLEPCATCGPGPGALELSDEQGGALAEAPAAGEVSLATKAPAAPPRDKMVRRPRVRKARG
jgi:hypothetical protein